MDAATVGVLRDVTLLVWLAMLLGIAAYKWVRVTRPSACWNLGGRVEARPYAIQDGIMVAAISLLLLGGLSQSPPDTAAMAAAADSAPPELNVISMLTSIAIQLIIAALLLFYLSAARALNPVELFGMKNVRPLIAVSMGFGLILLTIPIVNGFAGGIMHWMKGFWPEVGMQDSILAFRASKDPMAKALLIVAAVIIAPLVEEMMFRGFIYGVVKRFTDGFFAAVCSAMLFAVVHYHVGSMFPLMLLALILCAVYEMTGSLLVPMIMHGFFNATSILVMLFFPQLQQVP